MNFALRLTGILKFHEVYLGEGASEGGTSDFQEGGSGVMPSSLEQHISNAREALGVDSYYSRWMHIDYYELYELLTIIHNLLAYAQGLKLKG